jgi:activator of Hsp90 ATPase-like protein
LTDASEVARWFPLEARVTPGLGGKVFVSWGPAEGEAEIVAWEPSKKFSWKDPMGLVEWTLESRGGKTIVHLLQSGFLGNADWENEWFDSTSYGWAFILLSLQVALERHRGTPRQVAWPRLNVTLSREDAFVNF